MSDVLLKTLTTVNEVNDENTQVAFRDDWSLFKEEMKQTRSGPETVDVTSVLMRNQFSVKVSTIGPAWMHHRHFWHKLLIKTSTVLWKMSEELTQKLEKKQQ